MMSRLLGAIAVGAAIASVLLPSPRAHASEAILIQVYQACGDANSGELQIVRTPYLAYTGRDDLYRLVGRTCDSSRIKTPWGWDSGNSLQEARLSVRSVDAVQYRNADSTDTLFVELDARTIPKTYDELFTTKELVKRAVQCILYNAAATLPTPKFVRLTVLGPPDVRRKAKDYRVANYRYGPPR